MSMLPQDDPNLTGPLDAGRRALDKGDLATALRQVASALSEDPNRADSLALLDEILAATADPLDLLPADELPTPSGLAAVHAYILADQGRIPEAVDKLLGVVSDRPDVLFIDWVLGWLQRPEAAGRLDLDRLAEFVGTLLEQFAALTAPHGGGRDTLARMPLFIQLIRRTQRADAHFLTVAVALLCRLGNLDEALKLAREAYAADPSLQTAVALAGTHAVREELDQALEAYRQAIDHEPADVSARLCMADLLVNHGRLQEAQELYAEVLEQDPDQEIARPSQHFLRFMAHNEEPARDELLALAEEQPENERAQRLAQRATPYVGYLPEPPDVSAILERSADESEGKRMTLPYLGAPSNYVAFAWLEGIDLTVARVQKPDPRLPRCPVDYLLWKYDGTRPRIAVAAPGAAAADAVAEIAMQPYHVDAWWNHARRAAQKLGPEKVDDLLATMVYPPHVSQVDRPAAWVYHVQVAAALVIAHIDEGWADSLRRKALYALANGPMDWTVDAALVALAALAREDEEAARDIARLFRELRTHIPADGTSCCYPALLWCAQRLPGAADAERADLREKLRQWRDAREAERHFRRALAHAERGELDPAIAELTATVQLDPQSADAFQQRAVLSLRRADAHQAVADFTQALQLQPETATAFLGRGQAHLKLGRLDQAIGDFSEAVRLTPWDWQPWYRRGLAHSASKEHTRAIADFTEVIRLAPGRSEVYLQRAFAYQQLGQLELALGDYTEQVRLNPRSPLAYNSRGRLHHRLGNHGAALADHLRSRELDPGNANTHAQLAWIWATCPDAAIRDAPHAVQAALRACELTEWKKAACFDTLAAAHAEAGRFDEAVRWAQQAVELATPTEKPVYRTHLESFRQRRPWRAE